MTKNKVTLKEIVDFEHLQKLQDSFAAVARITSVVIDPNGLPLTVPSNLYGFCALMQSNELSVQKCIGANTKLIQENLQTGKPAKVVCPHSGLITASVPIFLGKELLGCWILGQVRIEDPPDEVLDETACQTGMDARELKDVMHRLPVFTTEQFEHIFDYLVALSETLIKLANAGFAAKKKNKALTKLANELKLTGEMLTHFIDSADVAMYVCDYESGEVLIANESMAKIADMPKEEMVSKKCQDILFNTEVDRTLCDNCPRQKLVDKKQQPKEMRELDEIYIPHTATWLRRTMQAIRWIDGRLAIMVTFSDITYERNMQRELEELAFFDHAMHLPNMLKLVQDFSQPPEGDSFLVCFDIKELRRINDAYGRSTGDSLLYMIVDWVKQNVGPDTAIYRIDGDEFCIFLKDSSIVEASKLAMAVYDKFEHQWVLPINGKDSYIFCSVSMCIIDGQVTFSANDSLASLIERAMDTSRAEGAVAIYNDEMDRRFKERLKMEVSLKSAINSGMQGFSLCYQPIVDADTGQWRGLEALCRWETAERGFVPPDIFIHEAERLGLIDPLGQWVLEEAVRQCKEWRLDELPGFFLDVNFSPLQIADEALAKKVLHILKKHRFPGGCLCMEITESMEHMFSGRIRDIIESLRAHDITVALDDFGVGYSSFQSLRSIPVSILKTERQFVQNIENDNYLLSLFRTMVELAHVAEKRLIAEGVETNEQRALVKENGADYIQGYFFSKPLAPHELKKELKRFYE